MQLGFTDEEIAFRGEVRHFLGSALSEEARRKLREGRRLGKEELVAWTRILHARGWAVPHWPLEWGGTGWDPIRQMIFRDEVQQFPAPETLSFGTSMVGPVIYTFGSRAQKERFLPRIARLDDWWCQGFSEPGAGSDLASLKTRAVRDGDHYVVNGQKAWTTLAQHADWIFVLARTDPSARKQNGISFLLVDMTTPGVTVRPVETIDGGFEINEVFFEDVRVPAENLVGEENKGWDYAKFLLGNERNGQARVGLSKARARRIRDLATAPCDAGEPRMADPVFRRRLAALEVEIKALEMTQLRVIAAERGRGEGKPDPASSILKIRGSELQQATTELLMDLIGPAALVRHADEGPQGHDWARGGASTYFNLRKLSIYGGSNEIQRTIIAKAILGL
ncbi:acyl-CoA dehydrogenase family protein [Xanthobacter autotrophicus]|uniref:acyl-CoA dehydrogenase family protein n=1 Tax=Xanthobacter TaxID=279 RepID=UPI0024AB598F|nr:acyl-CoA dehydrogenase family protein [Xanthobacter autotrophicus]MDI4663580.1 acyl-CoA dehydrogenase family protein [Xanthobacter autotrophicus]